MLVPIFAASSWWGIVGLDDRTHARVWSPAEVDAIRVAAGVLGSAVHRQLTEEALSQSEERFRQAQKLEAVGRLAGGVAHDFNNILTAITGYCEWLERGATDADRVAIDEIQKATARAAQLTRQLLTFSRRQILQPKVIVLNGVIAEMENMIRRLIGADIELRLASRHDRPIDVLISDIEMPGMGGRELAGHIRDLYPGIKVLLVSGHTEDESFRSGSDLPEAFLQKPFGGNELARSLHELLAD